MQLVKNALSHLETSCFAGSLTDAGAILLYTVDQNNGRILIGFIHVFASDRSHERTMGQRQIVAQVLHF